MAALVVSVSGLRSAGRHSLPKEILLQVPPLPWTGLPKSESYRLTASLDAKQRNLMDVRQTYLAAFSPPTTTPR
jgi:hypothetical protein